MKNRGKLKRAARRCNIQDPLSLSIPDILVHLEACKKQCVFYKEHGHRFCRKHLNTWLRIAKEQDDKESFQKISSIIQREHQQNFWRKLNYVTQKTQQEALHQPKRGTWRVNNRTHNPGVSQENDLIRSPQKALHSSRRSPYLQQRPIPGFWILCKYSSIKSGIGHNVCSTSNLG